MYEGELGRKVNGCWLFILVLCHIPMYYHDAILRRVSPASANADREYDSTQGTNKVDVLIIAHRALLRNELPLCAPCDG